MRTENGYSLVEMLSVTAILAVVAAIAVPNLLKAKRQYELHATAQQIAQVMQAAKFDAVAKSANRKIILDTTQQIVRSSTGVALTLPANVRFAALPSHVAAPSIVAQAALNATALPQQPGDAKTAISLPPGAAAHLKELTFTGKGLPAVEPGVVHWIYLENQEGNRAVVTITSMGSTAIQLYRGSGWQ